MFGERAPYPLRCSAVDVRPLSCAELYGDNNRLQKDMASNGLVISEQSDHC